MDEKHYVLTRHNLTQTIQIQLSQKQKIFFEFFLAFLKSILHLKDSQEKMTLMAALFPDILAPKDTVR